MSPNCVPPSQETKSPLASRDKSVSCLMEVLSRVLVALFYPHPFLSLSFYLSFPPLYLSPRPALLSLPLFAPVFGRYVIVCGSFSAPLFQQLLINQRADSRRGHLCLVSLSLFLSLPLANPVHPPPPLSSRHPTPHPSPPVACQPPKQGHCHRMLTSPARAYPTPGLSPALNISPMIKIRQTERI